MISKDVIRECIEANETSIRDYLNQFFHIEELNFSQFKQTRLAELQSMPVEDIKKVPSASFSHISWLAPVNSLQAPDALVEMRDIEVPEHLGDLRCYRFALRYPIDEFIRKRYIKNLEKTDREEMEEALFTEERKILSLSVFRFSSLLPFIHHQCPIIRKAMEEYKKLESLKELQHLVSGLSLYTECNRTKRNFKKCSGVTS